MTERDDPGGAVEPSTAPAPYGDNGFLEDYTAQVPRRAHRLAVLVTSNAAGQTQHSAANYRPRSSLLLMSRYWATSSPAPPYRNAPEAIASTFAITPIVGPRRKGGSAATRWTTRPETADDVGVVREVNLAAFPSAAEADLVDALRAGDTWVEGLSIVTEDPEGAVVGHALLTRCLVDTAPALALAPCAVLPRVQRNGAGSAAIRAGLQAARAKGENLVLVLGHAEYYQRFGFTPASTFGIRASFGCLTKP